VCRTMSEIDMCRSDRTKASTAAIMGIGRRNNMPARSFLINNAFSAVSKLRTPNMYCWSRKTLVAVHWSESHFH